MGGSNSSLRISCKRIYRKYICKLKRAFGAKDMLAVTKKGKVVCYVSPYCSILPCQFSAADSQIFPFS